MDNLLRELGYYLDLEESERQRIRAKEKAPSPRIVKWWDAAAPYLAMAYQAGLAGESLTHTFPFLREIESAPAAGTAETQQEQKPYTMIPVYHGDADGVKEVLP